MKKGETSWGGVADWYDDLLSGAETYQQTVILPNLLRLVAPTPTDKILDLACGNGFFSRAWAASGAEVVGVDLSPELIKLAQSRTGPEQKLRFLVAPAEKLPWPDRSVDKLTCVLALQNIAGVKEALLEVARVLRPGGKFFLVLNHPGFRIPQYSAWGWDESAKVEYRRLDQYLSESQTAIQMHPGADPTATTISFHRPLQYYFKLLGKAGFGVTRLEEWISNRASQPGPRAAAENKARQEFPLFLCLEARLL